MLGKPAGSLGIPAAPIPGGSGLATATNEVPRRTGAPPAPVAGEGPLRREGSAGESSPPCIAAPVGPGLLRNTSGIRKGLSRKGSTRPGAGRVGRRQGRHARSSWCLSTAMTCPASGRLSVSPRNSENTTSACPCWPAWRKGKGRRPGFLRSKANSRVRACVAFYHDWAPRLSGSSEGRPAWYQGLLDSDPGMVSQAAVQCAAAALRGGGWLSQQFWDIADDETHGAVARAATLDLLKVFPTRCSLRHLGILDDLLWGAIGRGAEAELLDLASASYPRPA